MPFEGSKLTMMGRSQGQQVRVRHLGRVKQGFRVNPFRIEKRNVIGPECVTVQAAEN
jgi:hypothetical protein